MKESYEEDLASHFGHPRRAESVTTFVEASARVGSAGQPTQRVPGSEITNFRRPILFNPGEGNNANTAKARCGHLRRSRRP
jgi:hypothetical protein